MIGIRKLVRMFEDGNIEVTGRKGAGKDVMFGNVISRINRPYISNIDYTQDDRFIPLDMSKLDCGQNTFVNFIEGDIKYYKYPYPDKIHIWISDAGNYFPSQYNNQLDKKYPYFATFGSLQRQLGDSNLHNNSQAYGRVWLKFREQCSDDFIRCNRCHVLLGDQGKFAKLFKNVTKLNWKFRGIVFASYYYYDKAESCENRIKPCRVRKPLLARSDAKATINVYKDDFYNKHGTVKKCFYVCLNKSKHDSRAFKTMLENGKRSCGISEGGQAEKGEGGETSPPTTLSA